MYKAILLGLSILLVLAGVLYWGISQHATSSPTITKSLPRLVTGHYLYNTGQFSSAIEIFAKLQNEALTDSEHIEVNLAYVLCLFREQNKTWAQKLHTFPEYEFGYWNGQTIGYGQNLRTVSQNHVQKLLENAKNGKSELILLEILFQNYFDKSITKLELEACITTFLQGCVNKDLCKAYCLLQGWSAWCACEIELALSLFTGVSAYDVHCQESKCGLMLAHVLCPDQDKKIMDIPWFNAKIPEYFYECQTISLLRVNSILHEHELFILKHNAYWQDWILGDLSFVMGNASKNPRWIYERARDFLTNQSKLQTNEVQPIYNALIARFNMAIAWGYLLQGNFVTAAEIWKMYENSYDIRWKNESILGLAVIEFKTNNIISPNLAKISLDDGFILAGHHVHFYRHTHRQMHKTQIDAICQDTVAKNCFLLLDVMAILGDGRMGYALLDRIVQAFPKVEYQELYSAEENNLPQDPYTESQIWEQLE